MTNSVSSLSSGLLSRGDIQPFKSQSHELEGERRTLSDETDLVQCELVFANDERLTVGLQGSGKEPTCFWHVMSAFKRLTQLTAGWDSYNAKPLASRAVRRSFYLLPSLLPYEGPGPTVVPTRDGGIQLEWHGIDLDIEVKIPPSGQITYFIADNRSGGEAEGPFNRAAVTAALARISGK